MHAMRDRERKCLHRGRKGHHSRPINKTFFSLSRTGEGDANEPVVVDKYTQTRQRWLKGKIVKFGHGRRYKKTSTMPRTGVEKIREEHERKNRIERKLESKKKEKDKKENKK